MRAMKKENFPAINVTINVQNQSGKITKYPKTKVRLDQVERHVMFMNRPCCEST